MIGLIHRTHLKTPHAVILLPFYLYSSWCTWYHITLDHTYNIWYHQMMELSHRTTHTWAKYYLHQLLFHINHIPKNKLQWKKDQNNQFWLTKLHFKSSSAILSPFCLRYWINFTRLEQPVTRIGLNNEAKQGIMDCGFFYYHGLTLISAWLIITCPVKCGMKLLATVEV